MGAGASAEGDRSIELFTVLMIKWDELIVKPEFAIDRPKPPTYEDFLNTAIPAGGMERAFFMEMRAYFHELVKNQKKCIIEISVNDDVYSENRPAQTLQEALQQRNSNINGKQRFRKLPNKRRKEQQVMKTREGCGPGAGFA